MPDGEFVDSAVPHELRERVLAAALDELSHCGVERFSVGALSARCGIDVDSVYRYWANSQRLLLDLMSFKSTQTIVAPNTGTLRGDLEAMALSVGAYLNTSVGRRLVRAMVMDDQAQRRDDTRGIYWRMRYETIRTILDQAALRGELREGIDHVAGIQILLAPINIRALYTDDPIDDAFCLSVAGLAWHALTRR